MRKVARRVCLLVVAESEKAALEGVRTGLERDVRDGSARAAEFGVIRARADAHGLDRLGRRNERRQQAGPVVVVDPLDLHVVGEPRLSVDVGREAVLRVEELRVRPERTRGARHRDQHALEIAVEPERHFLEVHALDDAAGVGAVGLQERRLADDGDGFLDCADLHLQIHAHRRVHGHIDILAHHLLEARELADHAIPAVFEIREDVVARLIGDGRVADVGVHLSDGHRRARHGETCLVGDVAKQPTLDGLRVEPCRQEKHEPGK